MTAEFVSGAYTWTYNSNSVGQGTEEGFTLSHQFFKRLVTGDAGGQTPQDAVYQGREQFLSARLIEARKTGLLEMIEPYAGTPGTPYTLGTIGRLDVRGAGGVSPTALCQSMVGTALTGTPAENDGPATITFPLAILAENFPVEILYGPDLREVPIRCRVYPNASGVFGTVT